MTGTKKNNLHTPDNDCNNQQKEARGSSNLVDNLVPLDSTSSTTSSTRKSADEHQQTSSEDCERPQQAPGSFSVSEIESMNSRAAIARKSKLCGSNRLYLRPTFDTSSSSSGTRSTLKSGGTLQKKMTPHSNPSSLTQQSCQESLLFDDELVEEDQTEAASTTVPPIFRSIDFLPSASIAQDRFDSESSLNDGNDHTTVITSASMATAEVVNSSSAMRNSRQQQLQEASAGASNRSKGVSRPWGNISNSNGGSSTRTSLNTSNNSIENGVDTSTTRIMDDDRGDLAILEERIVASRPSKYASIAQRCTICGIEETHVKESYGLFGLFSRMTPQTIEGRVYKGYCLCSHNDVQDLRRLLNDPNIPLNLIKHHHNNNNSSNNNVSLRLLQGNQEEMIISSADKEQSHLQGMSDSMVWQTVCCLLLVGICVTAVTVGVATSEHPEPWQPPSASPSTDYPTVAPTSYDWNLASVVAMEDVVSFGYSIDLSQDGGILAVTSPLYDGSRGRLDIFRDDDDGKGWHPVDEPIVGDLTGDQLGIGMAISGDGKTVAVGLPGNNHGTVQVYSIDPDTGLEQKGQSLDGPAPLSQFGFSVSLNEDGSRLFVGAPEFGDSPEDIYGLVQAYDFDGTAWIKVGRALIGESPNTRFGESVSTDDSGDRVAIGAPTDSVQWEREGKIDLFTWNDHDWVQLNANTELKGSQAGAHIGQQVSMARSGAFVGSGGHNRNYEKFLESGIVRTWRIDKDSNHFMWEGDPVSGTYEMAHLGHHVDIDIMTCDTSSTAQLRNVLTMVTSSKNRNGEVGYALFAKLGFDGFSETKFEGPELGDTEWFGEGPPVTMAGQRCQFAVGYESIRFENSSRSEIHIYDYVAV